VKQKQWYAAEVATSARAREAIEYGLMEAGALGTETTDAGDSQLVTGYFDERFAETEVRSALLKALRIYNLDEQNLRELKNRPVADRDWLAEWKKSWQPVAVGRFLIAPPWIETSTVPQSSIVVVIEPGMAFGTGTHETTRLCLKAIDKYFRGGSFLDVGTGTGVLAIAAAKMFSESSVIAVDTDADALAIAQENARLNQVAERIHFQIGTVDEQTSSADFVCANLTATVITELLPLLLNATCGRLVLSGILDSQQYSIESRLSELGVTNFETDQDGEWISILV
jgi:ribosomal protein L11 methyltransferase